jgi:hypothetical protein
VAITRQTLVGINAPDSIARAKTAPTANVSYVLNKNGVAIGSVNFLAGSRNGAFTLAEKLTLSAGDTLEVVTPSVVDAAIKDVTITIVGRAIAPQLSMTF